MKIARQLSIVLGAALACGACNSTPPPVSAHNLERPSDIAFACVGLFTPGADGGASTGVNQVSGRPMYECNNPGAFDPPFDITRRTFGFVANSARGELSVIDLNNSKLIDLDLANPETNVAPLGVLPEQMSASSDGCRIVTANRGSCDLTMVDVGTLMAPELGLEGKVTVDSTGPSTVSQEIVVRGGTTGKPLRLNPQEVVFLPQDTSAISGTTNLCTRDRPHADPIGWNSTPTDPQEKQWKALVTYPTCNLVALVDLPSGNIVDSVQVNVGSDRVSIALQSIGPDPDCPVEDFCDGRTAPAVAAPDGGAGDGADGGGGSSSGTAVSSDPFVNPTGTRPSSIAIVPKGDRAYVGLTQASFVAALDIQPNHLAIPTTGGSIKLHENALGVNAVRLSVDPYRRDMDSQTSGQLGAFVGRQEPANIHHYLYVIARDGTVRVVDISPRDQLLPETECDVNVDPRFIPVQSGDPLVPDRTNICWPTEPPDLAHRRPLARGPGITLPSIPRDIAFAQLESFPMADPRESVLDGAYAFILTISGAVYEVNVAPTLRTEQVTSTVASPAPLPEVQPLVNTLRDQNMITFTSSLDPSVGPARVDLAPTVPALGPQISAINTTSPDDNATNISGTPLATYVFFPQQVCSRSTPNPVTQCDSTLPMIQPQRQTWNITWEGDLFGPSFSGQLTFGQNPSSSSPLMLTDQGVDFCQAGALPGDIVTLFGCTVDAQCGPAQVCRRSTTAPETADALPINGLCVPNDNDPTGQSAALNDCASLLNSLRRLEIVDAKSPPGAPSTLTLRPEIDEITSESLTTCAGAPRPKAPTTMGDAGADAGADGSMGARPCQPAGDDTRSGYACLAVDDSGPLRCAKSCASDSDCRSGRSCVLFPTADFKDQKICADAPQVLSAPAADPAILHKCGLDQLSSYKIGAGSSFLVQGTAPTPYVPGIVDPTTFSCVPNPSRHDRIPYFQIVNGVRTPIQDCTNVAPINSTQSADMIQNDLLAAVHKTPDPNPCLIRSSMPPPATGDGGTPPADGGAQADGGAVLGPPLRVLFQNRELRFMLVNFELFAGNSDLITFDVHGGFVPDQVVIPTTIDINLPNRIVLGPIDSQTQVADLGPTSEFPFLFVIDQRRLGSAAAGVGATRGQILRINPRRATTTDTSSLVPIYDDPVSTSNLWPIQ